MTRCDKCGKGITDSYDAIWIDDCRGETWFVICKECYQRINEWLSLIWRAGKRPESL